MVGLDAAGKTTILYKLKLGEIVTTIPTIGDLSYLLSGRATDCFRFQCRDGGVQEYLLYGVGCGRSGQDPTALETLCVFDNVSS